MNNNSFRDMMSNLIMPIENMIGLLDELENDELSDERKRMIIEYIQKHSKPRAKELIDFFKK